MDFEVKIRRADVAMRRSDKKVSARRRHMAWNVSLASSRRVRLWSMRHSVTVAEQKTGRGRRLSLPDSNATTYIKKLSPEYGFPV